MQLSCHCSACDQLIRIDVPATATVWSCPHCHVQRSVAESFAEEVPTRCLHCSNADLWRQKDFPQSWGLLMVALGAIISSIAWAYHRPVLALSILGAFAVTDMVLFWIMPDVLVCYRCGARHRITGAAGEFAPYDHEMGERYRQERLRIEQGDTGQQAASPG